MWEMCNAQCDNCERDGLSKQGYEDNGDITLLMSLGIDRTPCVHGARGGMACMELQLHCLGMIRGTGSPVPGVFELLAIGR